MIWSGARCPVKAEGGWGDLVEQLQEMGVGYSVAGIVATWSDRADARAGTPMIYVRDPQKAAEPLGAERAHPWRGILFLEATSGELDAAEIEGGARFMPVRD